MVASDSSLCVFFFSRGLLMVFLVDLFVRNEMVVIDLVALLRA